MQAQNRSEQSHQRQAIKKTQNVAKDQSFATSVADTPMVPNFVVPLDASFSSSESDIDGADQGSFAVSVDSDTNNNRNDDLISDFGDRVISDFNLSALHQHSKLGSPSAFPRPSLPVAPAVIHEAEAADLQSDTGSSSDRYEQKDSEFGIHIKSDFNMGMLAEHNQKQLNTSEKRGRSNRPKRHRMYSEKEDSKHGKQSAKAMVLSPDDILVMDFEESGSDEMEDGQHATDFPGVRVPANTILLPAEAEASNDTITKRNKRVKPTKKRRKQRKHPTSAVVLSPANISKMEFERSDDEVETSAPVSTHFVIHV